jgi:hypothetical protein
MVCLTKYDHMVVDNRAAGLAGIKPGLRTPAASLLLTSVGASGFGLLFVARLSCRATK